MTPYEIRLELLKLANQILAARAKDNTQMPASEAVIAEAEKLNTFVSNKA
jgi:hypothetical protein